MYDEETGLYYLRSRYYNPAWGRFLNADSSLGKPSQLFGHNAFAYCYNNPILQIDSDGCIPNIALMLAKGELHDIVVEMVREYVSGQSSRSETKIFGAGRRGGFGYPDVVTESKYAWEIKPDSLYGLLTGPLQMRRYTNSTGYLPGHPVDIDPFPYVLQGQAGMVSIRNGSAFTGDAGVVYYNFVSIPEPEPQAEAIPERATQPSTAVRQIGTAICVTGIGFSLGALGGLVGIPGGCDPLCHETK